MKRALAAVVLMLSCSLIRERLAVKECNFSLKQARPYEFTLSDLKLDLVIGIANPNKVDAVLDRFDYQLVVGGENVLSGATGQRTRILAGKTKDLLTTVTINYQSISTAILKALKEGNPTYEMKGRAYIDTPIGSLNYPVTIKL
jgi:LEA14-like dessication related protein